jgi:hypothetical protein
MKTVAEILNRCKLNDILLAGPGQQWLVCDLNYDGCVVAKPYQWKSKLPSFELWSCGVESIAIISKLRIKKD